ncbi:MAG: glycosyltransferase family 2 protein [Clostridia bacterium]|nr:glycosyltransferase family 2 protein [Clostridia bacterium]
MIKAIFTNIKDEHRYLEEWLEYHIRMGFNKFILFEDAGSRSHLDIINKYSKVTNIDFYDNILKADSVELKDITCFNYILENYNDIDWIIKLDPDEYLVLDNNMTIDDLLYNVNDDVNQITYLWKLYNACGLIEEPSHGKYSVVDTYIGDIDISQLADYFTTNTSKNEYELGKSFLRYKWFLTNTNLHISDGFPHYIIDSVIFFDNGHINHYITKSFEEFYNRLKNKGEYNKEFYRKIGDFFVLNPDMIEKIPEIESKFDVDIFSFETKIN